MGWCVCSPTRAMLLTGRHPYRVGTGPETGGELAAEETTIAEVFQANGYRTGVFGRWHNREHRPHDEGYTDDLVTRHAMEFIRDNRERPFFCYVHRLKVVCGGLHGGVDVVEGHGHVFPTDYLEYDLAAGPPPRGGAYAWEHRVIGLASFGPGIAPGHGVMFRGASPAGTRSTSTTCGSATPTARRPRSGRAAGTPVPPRSASRMPSATWRFGPSARRTSAADTAAAARAAVAGAAPPDYS